MICLGLKTRTQIYFESPVCSWGIASVVKGLILSMNSYC